MFNLDQALAQLWNMHFHLPDLVSHISRNRARHSCSISCIVLVSTPLPCCSSTSRTYAKRCLCEESPGHRLISHSSASANDYARSLLISSRSSILRHRQRQLRWGCFCQSKRSSERYWPKQSSVDRLLAMTCCDVSQCSTCTHPSSAMIRRVGQRGRPRSDIQLDSDDLNCM